MRNQWRQRRIITYRNSTFPITYPSRPQHMKYTRNVLAGLPLILGLTLQLGAQTDFSPEAYLEFREDNRHLSAAELTGRFAPQTTYYASRQNPAVLGAIPWFDSLNAHFRFTLHEKALLEQNHFMVSQRLSSMSWAEAFIQLYSADLPLFLSSDFVLSTLHNSYDAVLQTIELELLEPNLKVLLKALYQQVPALGESYGQDPRFAHVLADVDLYIAVARSLAEGEAFLPQLGGDADYHAVMDAVAAEEMVSMPLFTASRPRKLDFSQFTPRGHYNKEIHTPDGMVTQEDYFRAMMWLGRIDFLLTAPPENPWEPDWTQEELRRMQLGALLLNEALLNCGKGALLNQHEQIIGFLVGPDDNLTPAELQALGQAHLQHPSDLFDPDRFEDFSKALNASDDYGQKIMSNFFLVDPDQADPGQLPVSYKLMGQKFLIDSYVFSEVVYDRIAHDGKKVWRALPDPLDAMAALGNEDALALLEDEMDRYHYAPNMAGLKYMIESYEDTFWESSLYNTWLAALRGLNPVSSSQDLPYFMKTTAWHAEKLNTQLCSWAQLRHDNILYGKQSYTGGTSCSYPFTYVEPYPAFYRTLGNFARKAEAFLGEALTDLPSHERMRSFYQRYAEIMDILEELASKELSQSPFSENEIAFMKSMINSYMASGPSITGWYTDLFFSVEKALGMDFTVADVHTQPTDESGAVVGNVLHVGNGNINMGVFLAENPCQPGKLMAFAGPVSSFHVDVQNNFKRLTDQEWEAMFWENDLPSRPDWVASYLAGPEGEELVAERSLKGSVFTGTGNISEPVHGMDYLLLFPNPAQKEAFLRFVLNRTEDLYLEVYDPSGRLLHSEIHENLPAAEHHLSLPVQDWGQGFYLVKTRVGKQIGFRELVVQ